MTLMVILSSSQSPLVCGESLGNILCDYIQLHINCFGKLLLKTQLHSDEGLYHGISDEPCFHSCLKLNIFSQTLQQPIVCNIKNLKSEQAFLAQPTMDSEGIPEPQSWWLLCLVALPVKQKVLIESEFNLKKSMP